MKKRLILLAMLLCLCIMLGACKSKSKTTEDYHIDLADPSQGIYTASDLISFFEQDESNTAVLGGCVDLAGDMLKLTKARGEIRLIGNGNSITSGGDCVIRMEDGAKISLENVKLIAGADGIGCLGDAEIGGAGLSVEALTNGVYCAGNLTVQENSDFDLAVQKGSGLIAKSLLIEKDASIVANGCQSAVHILKNDVTLMENAKLSAETSEYYCALKCAGMLRMEDGAELTVKNLGEYHGAEIDGIQIDGKATIYAEGGTKGAGLFLFGLDSDLTVAGYCDPEPRFESGNGSLRFVKSIDEIPEKEDESVQTSGEDADMALS